MWPCVIQVKADPKDLRNNGPFVFGSFNKPPSAKLPSPPSADCLLIDTGSPSIGIDEELAESLNLERTRTRTTSGIGGELEVNLYMADLLLPVKDSSGKGITFVTPLEVVGVKGMTKDFAQRGILDPDGRPARIVGLIGRVFLQFCEMDYDGRAGKIELRIYEEVSRPRSD